MSGFYVTIVICQQSCQNHVLVPSQCNYSSSHKSLTSYQYSHFTCYVFVFPYLPSKVWIVSLKLRLVSSLSQKERRNAITFSWKVTRLTIAKCKHAKTRIHSTTAVPFLWGEVILWWWYDFDALSEKCCTTLPLSSILQPIVLKYLTLINGNGIFSSSFPILEKNVITEINH